ncbi:MAG: hypothetical protein AAGA56_05990 [Myxococcota bacterium]
MYTGTFVEDPGTDPASSDESSDRPDYTLVSHGIRPADAEPDSEEPTRVRRGEVRVTMARNASDSERTAGPPSDAPRPRDPEIMAAPTRRPAEAVLAVDSEPRPSDPSALPHIGPLTEGASMANHHRFDPAPAASYASSALQKPVERGARPFSDGPDGLPRLWLTQSKLNLPYPIDISDTTTTSARRSIVEVIGGDESRPETPAESAPESSRSEPALDSRPRSASVPISLATMVAIVGAVGFGAALVAVLAFRGDEGPRGGEAPAPSAPLPTVQPGTVGLRIEVEPAYAEVTIDGDRMRGVREVIRPCDGPVAIEIAASAHVTEAYTVPCGSSMQLVVHLRLK